MAKSGASRAALDFTRQLDNQVYLQSLDQTGGPVLVAHVVYPFRANENDAWFLVNGTPMLIDVDNRRNLKLAAMRSSAAYLKFYHNYRNVTFWPAIAGRRAANGEERREIRRRLSAGDRSRLRIIGRVRYAFDFDAPEHFLAPA